MAIELPKRESTMGLKCPHCAWTGTTSDLNEVEGYTCPKCAEPLFPPGWLKEETDTP